MSSNIPKNSVKIPKNPFLFGLYTSKPYKKWMIAAFTAVFLASIPGRLTSIVLGNLTDALATVPLDSATVWLWGIATPAFFVIGQIFWRMSGFTGMRWFTGMRKTGINDLYGHLSIHNKEYFANRFAGSLVNKISNAVEGANDLYIRILWKFLPAFLSLILYIGITWSRDWRLGAIIFVWVVIFLGFNIWRARRMQEYSHEYAKATSVLKGHLVDSISNISIVHEYAHISGERKYIQGFVKTQYARGLAHWWYTEWVMVANGALVALFALLMIGTSILLFQAGIVTLGVVIMVTAVVRDIIDQIFFVSTELAGAMKSYGESREGLEEILKDHRIKDMPGATVLKADKGEISIKKINFEYDQAEVFENFSLQIPVGIRIGLVGRSGAGKTTLVSLLLRHYDVQAGSIEIDGQNIHEVTLESLRRAIAFVPQDTSLFHRTIRENIGYSSMESTDSEIEKAAKQAQAHDFIMKLPKGYDTLVGERGVKLSGGQRQRIAIARAFLKNSPILILDEATSSLDSQSEHAIQEALDVLMKGRTVIAIAHRLSTLKKMDQIVVIENGKVIEEGEPEKLISKPESVFKQMWDHQISGFIVDEE